MMTVAVAQRLVAIGANLKACGLRGIVQVLWFGHSMSRQTAKRKGRCPKTVALNSIDPNDQAFE